MENRRIEYIDAMRGFTMILVVYSHICNYCLGSRTMGFNDVFFLFRLPCFFFISGWLFEKPGRQWSAAVIGTVMRHKFMVLIVPTFIFLLLLAPPPLFFSRMGATKGGYWFTFSLFEFLLIYILSAAAFREKARQDRLMLILASVISVVAFGYDASFNRYFKGAGWWADVLGLLSFITWRYYLFFVLGVLAKRHSGVFLRWADKRSVLLLTALGFCAIAALMHINVRSSIAGEIALGYFIFAVGGILGMMLVFIFFRSSAMFFAKERVLGRCLQYIGTRTLDIYLLHYFFLPRFLLSYGEQLHAYDSRLLELTVAMSLTLMIVILCLLVSSIIRLNHFMGHYLFGVRYEKTK